MKAEKQQSQLKDERFDKFVFYACIIDNLFLPYVWFVSIPYTLPLLYVWIFLRFNSIAGYREFKVFLSMFLLMVFSTLFGCLSTSVYLERNIVYLIQFTTMFLYYFLFKYFIDRYPFRAKQFLILFVLFVIAMAVLFNLDKSLYHTVMLFWNRRSGISINENLYEDYVGYRYSFVWMDPNNIAYMMNAILLYLWCNEKTSFFLKTCTLISLLFLLVSCMSNGGFVTLGISAVLFLFAEIYSVIKEKRRKRYRVRVMDLILFTMTVLVVVLVLLQIPEYMETGIALESMERVRSNTGESRFVIWRYIIDHVNFFKYLILGRGGVTIVDGKSMAPHNGHFYWILGYGMIAYLEFMYLVFWKRRITPLKKYIWIIPILLGFTINVMLGEIKMMGITLLLIACSTSKRYLENEEKTVKGE